MSGQLSPKALPSVGVVVVNYNSASFVREFAESLRNVDYPNFRVIIVDNASTDGSPDTLRELLPDAVFIPSDENTGTAGGNNIGFRYCVKHEYDFALALNNDTVLTPDFLSKLADAADERTIVVPKILYHYDRSLISTHAGGFDWRFGRFRNTYHGRPDGPATSRPRDLQTASFCCALIPVAAFGAVGMLDERFFMYYEETDWLRRALAEGYRLRYVPEAVVYHMESGSSGGGWMTPFKLYYATRNRLYLVRKNQPSRLWFALFTAYFLAGRLPYLALYVARRRWRMLQAMLLGVWHYYRGKMGRTLEVGRL
ncbi:MAG: glycosyltransferase family 2 protein [Dehalococcoidia bacterium]|nr:glycosyltransferase family 2 protein [Dehalococcoidia bacterium]